MSCCAERININHAVATGTMRDKAMAWFCVKSSD
jgi:hypothetical protein